MVQILPQRTNLGSNIGRALGAGVSQGASEGLNIGVQRSLLRSALEEAKQASQPKTDEQTGQQIAPKPLDIIFAAMQAGAGIPGSERYLGQIIPLLLQQAQAGLVPGLGGEGQGQAPNLAQSLGMMGQPAQGAQGQEEIITQTQERPLSGQPHEQQQRDPFQVQDAPRGTIPIGATSGAPLKLGEMIPFPVSKRLNPEQEQQILKNVRQAGGDVEAAEREIDRFKKGQIDLNELQNINVDRLFRQQQRQLEFEGQKRNFLQDRAGIGEDPAALQNVAYGLLSNAAERSPDLTSAWRSVEGDYRNFKNQLAGLENAIPEVGLTGGNLGFTPDEKMKFLPTAKNILKKYPGAYPTLVDMFVNKGHNPIAIAEVLNPLSDRMNSSLEKVPNYWEDIQIDSFNPERSKTDIDEIFSEQQSSIPKVVETIRESWSPTTSVLGLYGNLKSKGWMPNNINELFSELANVVDFSEQQQAEMAQALKNPPVPFSSRSFIKKRGRR